MSSSRPLSISISLIGPDALGESVAHNSPRSPTSPTSPGRRIEVSPGEAEKALDRLSHMLDNKSAYSRDDTVPSDLAALLHTCFALEANQWASTAERTDGWDGAVTGPQKVCNLWHSQPLIDECIACRTRFASHYASDKVLCDSDCVSVEGHTSRQIDIHKELAIMCIM